MKTFKITASEEVWYEKIVKAESEDHAYEIFCATVDDKDITDGLNFEVHSIVGAE